jgi:hypothetical protein
MTAALFVILLAPQVHGGFGLGRVVNLKGGAVARICPHGVLALRASDGKEIIAKDGIYELSDGTKLIVKAGLISNLAALGTVLTNGPETRDVRILNDGRKARLCPHGLLFLVDKNGKETVAGEGTFKFADGSVAQVRNARITNPQEIRDFRFLPQQPLNPVQQPLNPVVPKP